MFFDPLYFVICLPFLLLGLLAQMMVKGAFAKWSRIEAVRGTTGADAARLVLREAQVEGVSVESANGFMSDHYDPRSRVIRLSPDVYSGRSVAALGVAAHEAGHAVQHARAYAPLALRSLLAPMVMVGGNFFPFLFILGAIFFAAAPAMGYFFIMAGFIGLSAAVLFSLITLPVEFNASTRALSMLRSSGLISSEKESLGVRAVLNAAALTYVAAAVALVATLIYYLIRYGGILRR
jgi:hypothetical protein